MLKRTIRSLRRVCRGAASPRRMKRTRGFGVHSPFAFRFIREVLNQPCAFYCYPQLEAACRADATDPRVAKALFRIALHFAPDRTVILGAPSATLLKAVELAGVTPATDSDSTDRAKCIVAPREATEECRAMWEASESGMLFCAPEMAVFVRLSHLPHQRFDIFLR